MHHKDTALATAILYFNKPALTMRCISAVRRHTDHLILIDNGSMPGVVPDDIPGSRVRLEPNQGFARGMNAALRAAFANVDVERVLLLSNDVEPAHDFYEQLRANTPTGNTPTIWCPHVYYLSDKSKPAYTHGSLDLEQFKLSHSFDPERREIQFPDYYPAAVTLWTRAAFELSGGFNESYFCYWEDVELAYRCSKLGIRLISAPELRAHHLGRGTTGGKRVYSEHFEKGSQLTKEILFGAR